MLSVVLLILKYAAVAQLDRVFGYEPKGRGFESLQPYHEKRLFRQEIASFYNFWDGFNFAPARIIQL